MSSLATVLVPMLMTLGGAGHGACEGAIAEARSAFCGAMNANLSRLNLGYTYDCAALEATVDGAAAVASPSAGPLEESPGCKEAVVAPALTALASGFDATVSQACGATRAASTFRAWQAVAGEALVSEGVCGFSPLVLDLEDDGVQLSSLARGVTFDLRATGAKVHTAWIQGDDALLVRDLNRNGFIDSGAELFGHRTAGERWPNGFAALASLDFDGNGVVDSNDPGFHELRVWVDARRDGLGPVSETRTLREAGIRSLPLAAEVRRGEAAADGQGNWIPLVGTFIRENGDEGKMVDVFLRFERRKRVLRRLASAEVPFCHGG